MYNIRPNYFYLLGYSHIVCTYLIRFDTRSYDHRDPVYIDENTRKDELTSSAYIPCRPPFQSFHIAFLSLSFTIHSSNNLNSPGTPKLLQAFPVGLPDPILSIDERQNARSQGYCHRRIRPNKLTTQTP